MRLCLSQSHAHPDVVTNVAAHADVARRAAADGCELVLFPELSLTGYGLQRARALALVADDPRLAPLQIEADAQRITIACGAPLMANGGVEIGMLVFAPGRPTRTYAKQRLHEDEAPFYVAGVRDLSLTFADHTLAPGICFESLQPEHIAAAVARGATVYAASVAKPAHAMTRAHAHYAAMAKRHGVAVLMVNAVGGDDDLVSAGASAAWAPDGLCVGSLDDAQPGALFVEL